jgi:hypothetical protein
MIFGTKITRETIRTSAMIPARIGFLGRTIFFLGTFLFFGFFSTRFALFRFSTTFFFSPSFCLNSFFSLLTVIFSSLGIYLLFFSSGTSFFTSFVFSSSLGIFPSSFFLSSFFPSSPFLVLLLSISSLQR